MISQNCYRVYTGNLQGPQTQAFKALGLYLYLNTATMEEIFLLYNQLVSTCRYISNAWDKISIGWKFEFETL